jgi:hypothetical protein
MSNMLVRAHRKEDGAEVIGYFYARVWNDQVFANVQEVEAKDGFLRPMQYILIPSVVV